jgi:hypothetical protein
MVTRRRSFFEVIYSLPGEPPASLGASITADESKVLPRPGFFDGITLLQHESVSNDEVQQVLQLPG